MRVVFAPDGTRGDVAPLLALADAVRHRGHQVIVCAPPDAQELVEAAGIEFRPVGVPVRDYLSANADAVTRGGLRLARASTRYVEEAVDKQFEMLHDASRGVDAVVAAGVQVAAASIAEHRGIPYRYVSYCPAMFPSREHAPFLFESHDHSGWVNRLTWFAFLSFFEAQFRRPLDRNRARLGLPKVRHPAPHFISPSPFLAAWPELAPMPGDSPYHATQVGYLHPELGEPLPPKLDAFLEAGEPPVYFGFGSMTDPDAAATTRILLDAVARTGRRALLSAGWAGLGDGPLPGGVMTIGPVCHGRLFPRVAAVVHHGGAGTTSTAARAGVPQVIVPHLFDQFYWAHRIRLVGLGPPPVLRRGLRAETLSAAIEHALEEVVTARASDIGLQLRRSDPVSRMADALLSTF